MTCPSSQTDVVRTRSPFQSAALTLAGVALPFMFALVVWAVAAPRSEFLSVGDGLGVKLPDSGMDGGSQVMMFIFLMIFATVCAALVIWWRIPDLRRPGGVPILVGIPAGACMAAAAAATPMAGLLVSPPEGPPHGEVVRQAPSVGPLFFDRLFLGRSGPSWDLLPPGAGWFLLGAVVAACTVAVCAYLCDDEDFAATAV